MARASRHGARGSSSTNMKDDDLAPSIVDRACAATHRDCVCATTARSNALHARIMDVRSRRVSLPAMVIQMSHGTEDNVDADDDADARATRRRRGMTPSDEPTNQSIATTTTTRTTGRDS